MQVPYQMLFLSQGATSDGLPFTRARLALLLLPPMCCPPRTTAAAIASHQALPMYFATNMHDFTLLKSTQDVVRMMMGGSKDAPPELLELFAGKQMGLADKARPPVASEHVQIPPSACKSCAPGRRSCAGLLRCLWEKFGAMGSFGRNYGFRCQLSCSSARAVYMSSSTLARTCV